MKLYWAPHTCAIGIHILLEEIGRPYEAEKLAMADLQKPPFRAINPKGKVPTITRDDGSALTEFGAIATWLARENVAAGLIPASPEAEARALEIMDYAVGTLHGQAFGRIFMPAKFEPPDVVHGTLGLGSGKVKDLGRTMAEEAFAILDKQLAGKSYAGGERFGIADAALFYCERWAPLSDIRLPPNVAAHYERVNARPAVQRVRAIWGETGQAAA